MQLTKKERDDFIIMRDAVLRIDKKLNLICPSIHVLQAKCPELKSTSPQPCAPQTAYNPPGGSFWERLPLSFKIGLISVGGIVAGILTYFFGVK
jgi:hypothetical protein